MTYLDFWYMAPGPKRTKPLKPGISLTHISTPQPRSAESYGVVQGCCPDWFSQQHCLLLEYQAASPRRMFEAQAQRIRRRLEHQMAHPERKRTYLLLEPLGAQHSAENIVREQWIAQGVWDDKWGPAHDLGLNEDERAEWYANGHTFPPPISQPDRWAMLGWPCRKHHKSSAGRDTESDSDVSRRENNTAYCSPRKDCHDATRPCAQFLSALLYERRWVEDEVEFSGCDVPLDTSTITYCSLRKNWIEDGIWDVDWQLIPGEEWLHETITEAEYYEKRLQQIERNPIERPTSYPYNPIQDRDEWSPEEPKSYNDSFVWPPLAETGDEAGSKNTCNSKREPDAFPQSKSTPPRLPLDGNLV